MRIDVITRCATCSITLVALCNSYDALAASRVYVAFDGVTLVADDVDDAAVDRTAIAALAGTQPAFAGDDATRAAVLASIRSDWSAYAIEIVDERPNGDDWSMAVVTSAHPLGESVTGAAVLDCADDRGAGEIVFAFADADDDAIAIGATVSQELAHAYGLEHTDDPRDLVYPLATVGDASFLDECVALVAGSMCDDEHRRWCDDGQNAHAELLDRLGPAVADGGPPQVEVVSPGDGEQIVAGTDLEIEIDADDDVRVDRVVLFEGDRELGEDRSPPWQFVVTAVPAGSYVLRARAIDMAGHEQESETIAITAVGSGVGDVARGGDDDTGCRIGEARAPALAWWVLAAFGRRRRRRTPLGA